MNKQIQVILMVHNKIYAKSKAMLVLFMLNTKKEYTTERSEKNPPNASKIDKLSMRKKTQ